MSCSVTFHRGEAWWHHSAAVHCGRIHRLSTLVVAQSSYSLCLPTLLYCTAPQSISLSILPFLLPWGGLHELDGMDGDASGTNSPIDDLTCAQMDWGIYSTRVVPESFLDVKKALCKSSVFTSPVRFGEESCVLPNKGVCVWYAITNENEVCFAIWCVVCLDRKNWVLMTPICWTSICV